MPRKDRNSFLFFFLVSGLTIVVRGRSVQAQTGNGVRPRITEKGRLWSSQSHHDIHVDDYSSLAGVSMRRSLSLRRAVQ
jgi:hypothetical protein